MVQEVRIIKQYALLMQYVDIHHCVKRDINSECGSYPMAMSVSAHLHVSEEKRKKRADTALTVVC